jgi:transcriptional regulator with XRE-family HTH domain
VRCFLSFDSSAVRKAISNAMDERKLNVATVEKNAGLSRSSLYNFLTGRVNEPRLDVILAATKVLEIDPLKFFNLDNFIIDKKVETISKSYNHLLLLECSQKVIEYLVKRQENISIDTTFKIIKKVYEYSQKYSGEKLDTAFVEWSIDNGS